MIQTNEKHLVKISAQGEISPPLIGRFPYRVSAEGEPKVLPGMGGIALNVRVGDSAAFWEADHLEPGASLKCKAKDEWGSDIPNISLNLMACIGNEALVLSGSAKGKKGVVTGKHGGIEHILIDFSFEVLKKLSIGDKIQISAFGLGLKILNFSKVKVMNLDPDLFKKLKLKIEKEKLVVPVTHIIPAFLMGSGLGSNQTYSGDYDIQMFDKDCVKKYHLEDLCLGDFIAISDTDHSYGRIYRSGAISIGVIGHGNCVSAGHGPGVITVFTSSEGAIIPMVDKEANLAKILKLRENK